MTTGKRAYSLSSSIGLGCSLLPADPGTTAFVCTNEHGHPRTRAPTNMGTHEHGPREGKQQGVRQPNPRRERERGSARATNTGTHDHGHPRTWTQSQKRERGSARAGEEEEKSEGEREREEERQRGKREKDDGEKR
jgi:hypothetical protein